MQRLWRWLINYAVESNTQIFATTHSSDCVNALGWLHRSEPALTESTALFRLEPGQVAATRYTSDELQVIGAAQRYRELSRDLMLRRELRGGDLSPAQEAQSAAELNHCWTALTDEEQNAMEQWLGTQASPNAAPQRSAVE